MEEHKLMIKRAYESATQADGYRILVDRIWPRGVKKSEAQIDEWLKEITPSTELRKWFNHEPVKFPLFTEKYRQELEKEPAQTAVVHVLDLLAQGDVTLVYGAKDTIHNHAIVLKEFLEEKNKPKDC